MSQKIDSQTNLQPVPESFRNAKDTFSSGTINWKSFYKDPKLTALIDYALANNFEILTALQKIKASQSEVLFNKGAMLPNVSGIANAGVRRFGVYTMDGAGNATTNIKGNELVPINLPDYLVGLQTSWEIDAFGKLKNQKKAAVARLLSSEAMKNVVTTNLIAEIALNYYELVSLDQSLLIIDKNITIQESALEMVRIMKSAASSNELAVKQFNTQLLNLKTNKIEKAQQITEIENKINYLLGRYPQKIERVKDFNNANLPSEIQFGIPSSLLQNRPDIKMAEFELIASKADVNSAKARFYPNITLTGTAGYQAYKPDLLFNPQSIAFNLIGGLAAPILNRSAIKANFNKANTYQIEAMYNYQSKILNGYFEVDTEMVRINNLKEMLKLKTEETQELKSSIEIATDLFKYGRANYLEVLNVQKNALQTELELIETQKKQFQTIINIYKALGGGWEN